MQSGDDSASTILTTRYGHQSVRLIHSIEKNLIIIAGTIVPIVVLAIIDVFGGNYLFPDSLDEIIDVAFSVIAVGALVPLLRLLLKSKRVLDSWAEMFERNSLVMGMSISMANRSKEEAVSAVAESVQEIGESLQKYIASKADFNEFLNVSIGKDLVYDVLIDAGHVSRDNDLKNVLEEYGAIIIKIVDGTVDRNAVESFVKSLSQYVSHTGNQVGLGVIVGENIVPEAYHHTRKLPNLRVNRILIIEKPVYRH